MDTNRQRAGWAVPGVLFTVLIALILLFYQDTVSYLTWYWGQFEEGEYAHGYLVLMISAWLVFRKRGQLSTIAPCPDNRPLIFLVALSLLWMVSALVEVEVVQAVALILLVATSVWVVFGPRVFRELLFPLMFIFFAVPIWFPLSPVLQDLTAELAFRVVRLIDVPAFQQENMIVLPAGMLSVEDACSGIRYFLASVTLGTLYAYLNYSSTSAKAVVVAIAAGAGVLTNILRVIIIVYIGYATEMTHPIIDDHLMLGWYLFGGLVVLLMFIDVRLARRRMLNAGAGNIDIRASAPGEASVPCSKGPGKMVTTVVLGALLVSSGPAALYFMHNQGSTDGQAMKLELPAGEGQWSGPLETGDDWEPDYHGAIPYKKAYKKGNRQIILYVGFYPVQRQGEELITYLNRINNADIWATVYTRALTVPAGEGDALEQVMQNPAGKRRLVWYWYRVADRYTTNRYIAKMLQAAGMLTGSTDAYLIAISSSVDTDIELARKVLNDFYGSMAAPLAVMKPSRD